MTSADLHCHTHHTAGEADAPEPRADVVPHPDAAPADALSYGELQEEQRDADQYQQDEIGHQVCSCQSKQYTQQVSVTSDTSEMTLY